MRGEWGFGEERGIGEREMRCFLSFYFYLLFLFYFRTKPPVSLHGQILWREFNYLMAHCANQIQPGSWGKMK